MYRKLSSRSTFKPQLETLETRDLPSAAGMAVFMELQALQQGVQTMQTQANAASSNFTQFGKDIQAAFPGYSQATFVDVTKLGGGIESVRLLDAQIQAGIQELQQAIPSLLGGDQIDQFVALEAFSQVSGTNLFGSLLGGLLGGGSSSSLTSQAQSALDQVNKIATTTDITLSNGQTFHLNQTIDQMLS